MADKTSQERHRALVEAGWERRFTAEEPRLSEMTESYEDLGFEVRQEHGMIGNDDDCTNCFDAPGFEERYKTVYTRGGSEPSVSDDDMF